MSFGVAQSSYPSIAATAPDADATVTCTGARRLTVQISNQPVYLTFGRFATGGGVIVWDQPEYYLPIVGQLTPLGGFDAFKYRAVTPAARLPAGAKQAFVALTPR